MQTPTENAKQKTSDINNQDGPENLGGSGIPPPSVPASGGKIEDVAESHSNLYEEVHSNEILGKMFENLSSSMRAMNSRTLPSWDVNSKHQTIKSHIKLAVSMSKRYGWTDAELASELFLSLRGEARSIAESFSTATQQDFKSLEKELLKYFHTAKPQSQLLNEFNNYTWKPAKQSIPQFAAILRNKIIKMNNSGKKPIETDVWDAANEAWLRSRILQGIKQQRPEFGATLELMDVDGKSCSDLANFAQQKYDIYRINNDIKDEHFAALVSTDSKEKEPEERKSRKNFQNQNRRRDAYQARERQHDNPGRKQWNRGFENRNHHQWRNEAVPFDQFRNYQNHWDRNFGFQMTPFENYNQWHPGLQPWTNDRRQNRRYERNYPNDQSRYQSFEPQQGPFRRYQNDFDHNRPFEERSYFQPNSQDRRNNWRPKREEFRNNGFRNDLNRNETNRVRFNSDNNRSKESKFNKYRENPGTIIKRNDRVDYLKSTAEKKDDQKN